METLAGFSKTVLDPIEIMKECGWPTDHITVDDSIKPDFQIIRGTTHDGTMIFTQELVQNVLINLANKQSYFKPDEGKLANVKDIKYTVTRLRIATVFGDVDIPAGRFPGERQRARIGVKCEYIY